MNRDFVRGAFLVINAAFAALVLSCGLPALAQQSAPAKPAPEAGVIKMLTDITTKAKTLKDQGLIKDLGQTAVPTSIPLADEALYLAERARDRAITVVGADPTPNNQSLTYLLFQSAQPSQTGTINPYVRHTLYPYGTIPGSDLPASRELLLAIKILQSSGSLKPSDIFGMAMEVTEGDYPSAMLTAHNLLKEVAYSSRGGLDMSFFQTPAPGTDQQTKDLASQYRNAFKSLGLPLGVTLPGNADDPISIGQGNAVTSLIDKLSDLRPPPDSIPPDEVVNDKLGPWYHLFGPLFVSSIDPRGRYWAEILAGGEGLMRHLHLPIFPSTPDKWKEFITNRGVSLVAGDVIDVINKDDGGISRSNIDKVLSSLSDPALRHLGLADRTWNALISNPSFISCLRADISKAGTAFKLLEGLAQSESYQVTPVSDDDRKNYKKLMEKLDDAYSITIHDLMDSPEASVAKMGPADILKLKQILIKQIKFNCGPSTIIKCVITLTPPDHPKAKQPVAGTIQYVARTSYTEDLAGKRTVDLFLGDIDDLDALIRKGGEVTLQLTAPVKAKSVLQVGAHGFSTDPDGHIFDLLDFRISVTGFEKGDSSSVDPRLLQLEKIEDMDSGPATNIYGLWKGKNLADHRQWTIQRFASAREARESQAQFKTGSEAFTQMIDQMKKDPKMYQVVDQSRIVPHEIIHDARYRILPGGVHGASMALCRVIYRDVFVITWEGAEQSFAVELSKEYRSGLEKSKELIDRRFPRGPQEQAPVKKPKPPA